MQKSEILRKAEKLLARTDPASGGTVAECAAAAEILSRMLSRHQLSLADLTAGTSNESMEKRNGRRTDSPIVAGEARFRHIIALAYDCTTVLSGNKQWILGHASDVEIADYMATTLMAKIGEMAILAFIGSGAKARTRDAFLESFMLGAAEAISARIAAMREKDTSDERALVVVKGKELSEFVKREFPNLFSTRSIANVHSTAHSLGVAAGANVAIVAGVGQRSAAGGRLQITHNSK